MKKCTYCGTEMSGDFCPTCGKKFEARDIRCPKCGKLIWDNSSSYTYCNGSKLFTKFCQSCGYELEGNIFKCVAGLIIINDTLYGVIDKNVSFIHVPETIKQIRRCAFYDCEKISSIYIDHCLNEIDEDAFRNCGGEHVSSHNYPYSWRRSLSIYCKKMTKAQWLGLCKGNDRWWHTYYHSCSVYCSDGTLEYKYDDD